MSGNNQVTFKVFEEMSQTQQQLAQLFNDEHPNAYKYSKKYFFHFDDQTSLWKEVEQSQIIYFISHWILNTQSRLFNQTTQDEKIKLTKTVKNLTKYKYLVDVLNFLKTMITDEDLFDKLDRCHPHLLPVTKVNRITFADGVTRETYDNMILDLRNGEMHQRKLEHYFTYDIKSTPKDKTKDGYSYDSYFIEAMKKIMCNDDVNLKYLQKILGYSITGETKAQCLFIWWGQGSNGKSVILSLLQNLLSKAYATADKKIFINTGKQADCEKVSLKDARCVAFSESESKEKLNEGLLKQMSGGDQITARALYKDPITFTLMAKLILCTNYKPQFNGNDGGIVRRIKFVPFNARFVDEPSGKNEYKKDLDLLNNLLKNNMDDFLTFCLEGAIDYYKTQKINPPASIEQSEKQYINSQASLDYWFNEKVTMTNDKFDRVARSDVYSDYADFCKEVDLSPVNKSEFFEKFDFKINQQAKKYHGTYCYFNIKINNVEAEDNAEFIDPKSQLDL